MLRRSKLDVYSDEPVLSEEQKWLGGSGMKDKTKRKVPSHHKSPSWLDS